MILAFVGGAAAAVAQDGLPDWVPFTDDVPVDATAAEHWAVDDAIARVLEKGIDDSANSLLSQSGIGPPEIKTLGIAIGEARVQLVVQAKDRPVLLTGLRLVVDQRKDPMRGTIVARGTEGGGEPIQMLFDVDAPGADRSGTPARNILGEDYFDGNNYELEAGRTVEFRVHATSRTCHCAWHLELDVFHEGKNSTVEIRGQDGQDFEITAAAAGHAEAYTQLLPEQEGTLTVLGSIGEWAKVSGTDFCARSVFCDPQKWPEPSRE